MKKQILLYKHKHDDDYRIILEVLKKQDIHVIELNAADFNQTLGYISARDGFVKSEEISNQTYDEDFLIMDGLNDDQISAFLGELRNNEVNFQGAKAVITKHNVNWTLAYLYEELQQEHAFFQKYDEIMRLLKEANNRKKEQYTSDTWSPYQEAFLKAFMLVNGPQPSFEALSDTLTALQNSANALKKI